MITKCQFIENFKIHIIVQKYNIDCFIMFIFNKFMLYIRYILSQQVVQRYLLGVVNNLCHDDELGQITFNTTGGNPFMNTLKTVG